MKPIFQVFVHFTFVLTFILCQKNSDEGRPYEFGFTIDGQQHRHEKKDENGIIQGEFGFITADGIYHVTVYATDENGNFKILSMKNIRISDPLDGSPATGPISPEASKYLQSSKEPQSTTTRTSPKLQPPQFQRLEKEPNKPPTVVASTLKPQAVFTTKPTIKPACAGCGYVTTSKTTTSQPKIGNGIIVQPSPQYPNIYPEQHSSERFPQYPNEITPLNSQDQSDLSHQYHNDIPNQYESNTSSKTPNGTPQQSLIIPNQPPPDVEILPPSFQSNIFPPSLSQQSVLSPGSSDYRQGNRQVQNPVYEQEIMSEKQYPSSASNKQNGDTFISRNRDQVSDVPTDNLINLGNQTNQKEYVDILTNLPDNGANVKQTGRSGQLNTSPESTATSKLPPITVSNDSIHIGGENPKDIRIEDKFPGMVDGLPDGVKEKDITDILYKFKYTVGFHGHYEKGFKDGTKIGGYFVNGRDGYSRVVTYVADENGYRPKFKLINLGLDSPDTPKEDTEKTFGLKDFEFIWYPIE